MILRPFSLKKVEDSINKLSPRGTNRLGYIILKNNRQKSSKTGRSLCSIQTNRNTNLSKNKRIMSHRKLISVSSLDQKQNLTQRKKTVQSERTIGYQNNIKEQEGYLNKKKFHLNKFCQYRNDKLHTIQNQETQNIEKILQIKENILKQFIDRFQQQLRDISQQKSSRNTLISHRVKTQVQKQRRITSRIQNETTKKSRRPVKELESNHSTINIKPICEQNNKQNNKTIMQNSDQLLNKINQNQKSKFEDYLKKIQHTNKRDKKILIMKNNKKSLQNISISKIAQTQNITGRIFKNNELKSNNKLNLKQLFRHSKKYEPYLKENQTLYTKSVKQEERFEEIKEKQQNQEISSLMVSPIRGKQNISLRKSRDNHIKQSINRLKQSKQEKTKNQDNHRIKLGQQRIKQSRYMDCSSIQNINQSSFISQFGRKSILKHLQNQSSKIIKQEQRIIKQEQRKSKKCLAKMKNIFPEDFF